MFKSTDNLDDYGDGTAAIAAPVSGIAPLPAPHNLSETLENWKDRLSEVDWVPDLGRDIGSLTNDGEIQPLPRADIAIGHGAIGNTAGTFSILSGLKTI